MIEGLSSGPASVSPSFINRPLTLAELARWARHLLVRNPFYIVSATLLLLSMRLLSGDSRIFTRETPQLLFNFSSFQLYELLLVGTAVLLARRGIWYDAGLLVGVETMFVCVPFILISQALLLENQLVLAFCLTGCALAALRVHGLKRWLTGVNMPGPLLGVGALLLALNFAFPVTTRLLHEHVSVPIWDERGAVLQGAEWNFILPIVVALALLLPASAGVGRNEAFFARKSFPLLALFLWTAGTASHLYCIGYVYGLRWAASLLTPALWVVAWMLWARREDFDFDFVPAKFRGAINGLLFAVPLAAALLAAWESDWKRCCALSLLNASVYGAFFVKQQNRRALHLGLMSVLVALATVPHYWLQPTGIHYEHTNALGLCLVVYLVLLTICSRRPIWGIAGGAVLAAAAISAGGSAHVAIQLGLVFVILHSLRWADALHSYARQIRNGAAMLWLTHGLVWMAADFPNAQAGTFLLGLTTLVTYFCARGVFGQWGPRIIPYTALAMTALDPICVVGAMISGTPPGLVLLIGSFGLFALGTVVALAKERWHAPPAIAND